MLVSKEHKEILATQSASKTLSEWVEFFNFQYTKNQIYSYCYHNHYLIKKYNNMQLYQERKYHINIDYFKTWSRNMAYVFGFWYADGCIYGGRMFDITLHAKDKYILKQIAKELEYRGNLYDYVDRQSARLNFSCVTIYNDIVNLGGCEQGNAELRFPQVPQEYLPDFIRGYFDGKGCVVDIKRRRVNSIFICKSKLFLEQLLEILKAEVGIKSGSFDDNNNSLKFGKRDSLKLYNYMYKDNPELFLLRKKEKFSKYV